MEIYGEQDLGADNAQHGQIYAAKAFCYADRDYVRLKTKVNDGTTLITIVEARFGSLVYNGNQPLANSLGVTLYYHLKLQEEHDAELV